MDTFPMRVKELAEAKKLSIRRLSILAEVNINTVRDLWYSRVKRLDYTTLVKISTILEVKPKDLIAD